MESKHIKLICQCLIILQVTMLLPVENANILVIQNIGGVSHHVFSSGYVDILLAKGHNVTVFTTFPRGNRENYTEIDVSAYFNNGINVDLESLIANFTSPCKTFFVLRRLGNTMCDLMFSNDLLKEFMSRPWEFDLVVLEPLWSDCVSYVAAKMDLPLLYLSAFSAISFKESTIAGGISNPFEFADILLPSSYPKTFVQKADNIILFLEDFILNVIDDIMRILRPKTYEISAPKPPAVVLVNSHTLLEKPRPGAKKVVNVGGIHMKEPKPIPTDIEKFINDSPNGVIYLAFGATLKMSSIPKHVFEKFISAFEKVNMRVLLKYEDDFHFNSQNIMVKKWFPQRDILVHPNVKLFISHGGLCGIFETLDAGVPVVGIPIMGDQFRNIDHLVELGMAVSIPYETVTEENFFMNIVEVLNNKTYTDNAKKASAEFKESSKNNEELIIKWTEYAINSKNNEEPDSHTKLGPN